MSNSPLQACRSWNNNVTVPLLVVTYRDHEHELAQYTWNHAHDSSKQLIEKERVKS